MFSFLHRFFFFARINSFKNGHAEFYSAWPYSLVLRTAYYSSFIFSVSSGMNSSISSTIPTSAT